MERHSLRQVVPVALLAAVVVAPILAEDVEKKWRLGATIGGDLDCSNSRFINPGDQALSADGLDVKGGVFLRGVRAEGEVRLQARAR